MRPFASIRSTLVRRPWLYWIGAALVVAVAGWIVNGRMAQLETTRNAWGDAQTVLVTARDHRAGDPVETKRVELPLVAIPASALDDLDPGAEARHDLAAGEILVETDVATAGGPAALAADDTLTVGVRGRTPAELVTPGTRAQVFAEGLRLSDAATVVAVVDEVVFVAVPAADAAAVTAAAHADLATLAYEP